MRYEIEGCVKAKCRRNASRPRPVPVREFLVHPAITPVSGEYASIPKDGERIGCKVKAPWSLVGTDLDYGTADLLFWVLLRLGR